MASRTGEKIGWIGGWLGAFFWVIILTVIFLVQDKWAEGFLGLLLLGLAAIFIVIFAPWRRSSTPFWKLMTPSYVILFGSLLWAIWAFGGIKNSGLSWWNLLFLLPLLIPLVGMGAKTWDDTY